MVKHGIHGDLWQKGKIAELALGYGGGEGALKAMGALDMGLTEEELKPLVTFWRTTNPHIVDYWSKVDRAVKEAIENHRIMRVGFLTIFMQKGILFIELPSGRRLAYVGAAMKMGEKGYKVITYMGGRSYEKMGTDRVLRPQIRRKHCPGCIPGYPLPRHEEPAGPVHLRPRAR